MEQSKLIIRLASSNDAERICLLFNKMAPKYDRKINFWVWINQMLSEENSIIAIAEFNGDIVGHYAIIPQKIIVNKKEYRIGLGIHAAIEKEKRDLVSIYEISSFAYKEAKLSGLKFIYGFPNQNYRVIQEKIERWKRISLFKAYETEISNYKTETEIELDSIEIKKIDSSFSSVFEVSKILDGSQIDTTVYLKKSLNYYTNRYLKHPHEIYKSFIVKNEEGKRACLFLKIHKDSDNLIKGHLIDFIKEKRFNTGLILDIAFLILKEQNVDVISFWPINQEIKEILNSKRVSFYGFETFFAIKFLDKSFENIYKEELLNFENWTLQMGDSDAF